MTLAVAIAMVEGTVVTVLARKTFDVGPWMFATMMAAPMFANLTSFAWARLARGRGKVAMVAGLQGGLLVTVGAIALLPVNEAGRWLLTALVVAGRCLMTGVVTVRSTVWRMNYPRPVRAQVTGRLVRASHLIVLVVPLIAAGALDYNRQSFRAIYLVSMVIGVVGVVAYSRVRLRRQRELLRFERQPTARPLPHGTPGPIYEYDPHAGGTNVWDVLRKDYFFRRYMQWQFLAGIATMMGETVAILLIVDLSKKVSPKHDYLVSLTLTSVIVMLLAIMVMPLWARYLDRVLVPRVRSRMGWFWATAQVLYWFGATYELLGIFALARVFVGIAHGGGALAWTLGHNDFADRRMVALYMGIHVTLTGVRGAIGPFLIMMLYTGKLGPFTTGLAPFHEQVFWITATLAAIAALGFHRLDLSMRRQGRHESAARGG